MAGRRSISWPVFVGLVVVYLAIIQISGLVIGSGLESEGDAAFPTTEVLVRRALIPVALSLVFVAAVVTWLGWWRPALHEDRRVQRWVRWVPISMFVAAVLAINVPNLLDVEVGLPLSLLALVALVGFTEELMFRGVGVVTFREGGFSEGKVALWTSLIFGLAHLSNALSTGPEAIVQAAVVSGAGYFFYLTRRVSAGLLVPAILHATWDFGLLSSQLGADPDLYLGGLVPLLLVPTLAIVLIRRRRRIEPETTSGGSPGSSVGLVT